MNLLSLQYRDIARSMKEAIGFDVSANSSTRIGHEEPCNGEGYVFLERSGHGAANADNGLSPDSQNMRIKASPVFPESLLSTEVGINVQTYECADNTKQEPAIFKQPGASLDLPAASSLHYRLHDCVPDEFGTGLYQDGAHAVCILKNESSLAEADTALIHGLHSLLNKTNEKKPDAQRWKIQFFLENDTTRLSAPQYLQINSLRVEMHKLSHLWTRLSIIGKASLVVCDCAGVAVDSLRASVPTAFVKETPAGFEEIQACIKRFLQHQNYPQLLAEQKAALYKIGRSQNQYDYRMNNTSTLQAVVQTHLSQPDLTANHGVLTTPRQGELTSLILSSQQLQTIKPDKSVRLLSGLETSRRKLQKFKESPTRFMNDSQHRIVRSLMSGKTS